MAETTAASVPAPPERSLKRRLVRILVWLVIVAALRDYTDAETATAYSISQQLVTTAWNILFAIIMVAIFFGWTGGKLLIGSSYVDAKQKAAEMRAERKQKKAED